jgi:sulfhydrogenase subunit beta (sulfur reductase)
MEQRLIRKEELDGLVRRIAGEKIVLGPVREETNLLFEPLDGRDPDLSFTNTRNAPKNALFPHTETLIRFTRTPKGMEFAAEGEEPAEAVVLVRPCDARSFLFLDKVFDQKEYRDPYYIARRERTTVVSMACPRPPYTACFCTSVGGEPGGSEGADVLLTDLGEEVLAEFLTPKGEKLLKHFEGARPADDRARSRKEEVRESARQAIRSQVPAREVKPILDANFEHPFWATLHQKCLACGTCTYLCPTSGHNPRPSQQERWRQRLMHKFRYIPENFDTIGCVGCGRCVLNCPVNLDIRKIVEDVSKL